MKVVFVLLLLWTGEADYREVRAFDTLEKCQAAGERVMNVVKKVKAFKCEELKE